jgi:hypothetical protein
MDFAEWNYGSDFAAMQNPENWDADGNYVGYDVSDPNSGGIGEE